MSLPGLSDDDLVKRHWAENWQVFQNEKLQWRDDEHENSRIRAQIRWNLAFSERISGWCAPQLSFHNFPRLHWRSLLAYGCARGQPHCRRRDLSSLLCSAIFKEKNVLVSQRFPWHFRLKDQLKEESSYIVYLSLRGISNSSWVIFFSSRFVVATSARHPFLFFGGFVFAMTWLLQGYCQKPTRHESAKAAFDQDAVAAKAHCHAQILVCWIASGLTWFHHNSIHPIDPR